MPLTRPPTSAMTTNQPSIPTCLASSSEATVALLPSLVTCGKSTHVGPHPAADQARRGEPDGDDQRRRTGPARPTRRTTRVREPASETRSRRRRRDRSGWHLGLNLGRHPRHPGPSRCLRSPYSAGRRGHAQAVVEPQHPGGAARDQLEPHLGGARVGAQHLLELLDDGRRAPRRGHRDQHRSDAAVVHRRAWRRSCRAARAGPCCGRAGPGPRSRCPRRGGCWPAGSRWGRTARRWRPRGPPRSRSPRRCRSW